jgi:DNA-binding NarL/FixJ family response regulator
VPAARPGDETLAHRLQRCDDREPDESDPRGGRRRSDAPSPRRGFEILGELNARGKRTRVVLMTSFASPDVVESARAAGAAGVLSKPFGEDQLLEVLEQKS